MANKQLLLLRHAKSDWDSNARGDFERPLSARGRRDAPKMGRWLGSTIGLPERIIVSPAVRTVETVELVCAALSAGAREGAAAGIESDQVIYDRRLYHGTPEQIREIAGAQLESFERVLIVAHNPGMELALLAYCPTVEPFADGKLMPTCALAVIEFAGDADTGKLRALMRPSEL